jgi:hypothetical protein
MANTSWGDNPHNGGFLATARFVRNFCARLDDEEDPVFKGLAEPVAARLRASAARFGGLAENLAQQQVEERPKADILRLAEAIGNFAQELEAAGLPHECNAMKAIAKDAMERAKRSPEDPDPKGRQL